MGCQWPVATAKVDMDSWGSGREALGLGSDDAFNSGSCSLSQTHFPRLPTTTSLPLPLPSSLQAPTFLTSPIYARHIPPAWLRPFNPPARISTRCIPSRARRTARLKCSDTRQCRHLHHLLLRPQCRRACLGVSSPTKIPSVSRAQSLSRPTSPSPTTARRSAQ